MRNRVERVAFVKGDDKTPFAEVAQVLSMLRGLQIQPAMMPSVVSGGCIGANIPSGDSRYLAPPVDRRNQALRTWMQPIPWWRIW